MSGNKYEYKVEDPQVKFKFRKKTALCDLIYDYDDDCIIIIMMMMMMMMIIVIE